MKPLKPEDIGVAKKAVLPDEVIAAANELIAKKWNGHRARFTTDELADKIEKEFIAAGKAITPGKIGKENWLDIEDVYRDEGWKVEFVKEGWNDPAPDYYVFTKKN